MNTERDNWKDLTPEDATDDELRLIHRICGPKPIWLDEANWRSNMRACVRDIREHVDKMNGKLTPSIATPERPNLKVIFLDIDGVLSVFGSRGLCGTRLDMFADIVHLTGSKVVLSSTWRHPHSRDQLLRLEQELEKRNVELFSATPILNIPIESSSLLMGTQRGLEIKAWLDSAKRRYRIDSFVILDDDPNNEMGDLKYALVKCDGYQGLTPQIADAVVLRLRQKQNNGL